MAIPEPVHNDAAARNSVMDILQKTDVVDKEGKITEEKNLKGEEEGEIGESEEESEETSEEEESTESVDEEAVEIDSSTLAQLLGVDESDIIVKDDGSPLFRTKVDGEEKEISFGSLLRNFRLQAHVDNKATNLNDEREKFTSEMSAVKDQYKVALEQAFSYLGEEEKSIQTEMDSIDWDALQTSEPTQYIMAKENFRDRFFQLQGRRQSISKQYQEEGVKRSKEYDVERGKYLQKQADLLLRALPEWKDPQIAKQQSNELKQYALDSLLFNEEEVGNMTDHRAWLGIRKAMLYDKLMSKSDATIKKVVNLPKVVTRKAPLGKTVKSKAKLAAKKEAAITGDNRAKAAFISDLVNS